MLTCAVTIMYNLITYLANLQTSKVYLSFSDRSSPWYRDMPWGPTPSQAPIPLSLLGLLWNSSSPKLSKCDTSFSNQYSAVDGFMPWYNTIILQKVRSTTQYTDFTKALSHTQNIIVSCCTCKFNLILCPQENCGLPCPHFNEIHNAQKHYMQISYIKFHKHQTINVESNHKNSFIHK